MPCMFEFVCLLCSALKAKLEDFIKRTDAYKDDADGVQKLWDSIKDRLYSLSPREQTLGLREKVLLVF